MAYVSDYTFNGMSRIGNDGCCIDQNSIYCKIILLKTVP